MKPTKKNKSSLPAVRVADSQKALPASASWIRRLATRALRARRAKLRLSVVLLDDRTLRRLHRDFCDDDTETDVITFDLRGPGPSASGREGFDAELAISAEKAKKEARARGTDPRHELALYLVHGILHLEGYRDDTRAARARMRAAEKQLLGCLGLPHVF